MDARLWEDSFGVRRFNDAAIQRAVDSTLASVPGDAKAVVLDVNLDGNGVRGVAAFQDGNGFSVGVIGEIDARRKWTVGVRLAKVWT